MHSVCCCGTYSCGFLMAQLRRLFSSVAHVVDVAVRSRKSSKYRGVTWDKKKQKWQAFIYLDGKRFDLGRHATELLGYHATELAAAQAYDQEAKKYTGKPLNFPIDSEEAARRGAQCLLLQYLLGSFLMSQLRQLFSSVAHVAYVAFR